MRIGIAGERRKSQASIVIDIPLMVSIDWPCGVEVDLDKCRQIAARATPSSYETNVSNQAGKIIWAQCYTEALEEEATVREVIK